MTFETYLNQLEVAGELKRIEAEIDPDLELAAICRREFARDGGGSALYFNNVSGSPFPVAANLFGSEKRAAMLLHSTSVEDFSQALNAWLGSRTGSAAERLNFCAKAALCRKPALRRYEPTQLLDLPAIRSWSGEGGRYLNLALALTSHPDSGERNLGLYRAQVIDNDHLALNFSPTSGAGCHFTAARKRRVSLPVCLLLGVDPALTWVAAAPLPEMCDELEFYQSLFNEKIDLIEAQTQPLQIPANANVVVEGEIDPAKTVIEGAYGNHTGYYVTRDDCPLLNVTAVRYSANSVVPATVVGPPPSENIYLGMANEILIREMVKIDYPQIDDVWMPPVTIFHGAAVIAVKRQSVDENKNLIYQLWEKSSLKRSRFLLLVDEDSQLQSLSTQWWQLVNGLNNPRIYTQGGRTAIDATRINVGAVVQEDTATAELLHKRRNEYQLW